MIQLHAHSSSVYYEPHPEKPTWKYMIGLKVERVAQACGVIISDQWSACTKITSDLDIVPC